MLAHVPGSTAHAQVIRHILGLMPDENWRVHKGTTVLVGDLRSAMRAVALRLCIVMHCLCY